MSSADFLGPYLLGPNGTEENGIYIGDARELAKAIPDESVDLIFTDPIYDRIEDYRWLAKTGARILRLNSTALVWCMTPNILDVGIALRENLSFRWLLKMFRSGFGSGGIPINGIINKYTPCFWMEKGRSKPYKVIWDTSVGVTIGDGMKWHQWQKDQGTCLRWTSAFSRPGALVFDPFTGGGTVPAVCKMLGRRYLAFEIDPETAYVARERVRNTQPPLFVVQPEQISLPTLSLHE